VPCHRLGPFEQKRNLQVKLKLRGVELTR